jgi:membrane peptidoglycan carboxypeptidase
MASAYATIAASGIYHRPHFVQKVVNAQGEVLFDVTSEDNAGERRIEKPVADNVIAAMAPIPGWSNGHTLAGGRASAAKTGTHQLGDTGANRDAWMVGFTPSLSTAVWVGTVKGDQPLVNSWGGPVYGAGLPADIWKATMDGALKGTDFESFPTPAEVGGYAGVPAPPPPPPAPVRPNPAPVGAPFDPGVPLPPPPLPGAFVRAAFAFALAAPIVLKIASYCFCCVMFFTNAFASVCKVSRRRSSSGVKNILLAEIITAGFSSTTVVFTAGQ